MLFFFFLIYFTSLIGIDCMHLCLCVDQLFNHIISDARGYMILFAFFFSFSFFVSLPFLASVRFVSITKLIWGGRGAAHLCGPIVQ